MAAEWVRYCKGASEVSIDGDFIEVRFAGGRRHRLRVTEEPDLLRLRGVVARAAIVGGLGSSERPEVMAWVRNRATKLVGFGLDRAGRLFGEALVPKAGLTPSEFLLYVKTTAAACDRLEYQLTGRDTE